MKVFTLLLLFVSIHQIGYSQKAWSDIISTRDIVLLGEQAHGVQTFYDKKIDLIQEIDSVSNKALMILVESPLQLLNEVMTFFEIPIPDPTDFAEEFYGKFFRKFVHDSFCGSGGMNFFNPDTVAGFPAHYQEPDFDRHWFTSSTIIARYKLIESLIAGKNKIFPNANIMTQFDTVAFVAEYIQTPDDINALIKELTEYLYPESVQAERIDYFKDVALEGYEDYYWTEAWNTYIDNGEDVIVRTRLNALFTAIINASEFQLM